MESKFNTKVFTHSRMHASTEDTLNSRTYILPFKKEYGLKNERTAYRFSIMK